MTDASTIGEVAQRTGLTVSAIRYYEAEGIVAPASRTEAGYRLFTETDVRRLLLAKQARHLGLGLREVKALVEDLATLDCATFAGELGSRIAGQRAAVAARIAELRELEATLEALETHIDSCVCRPGTAAADCAITLFDHEREDHDDCSCM
ncbi:MAG TPA: MerR family transcriptional regulator [Dehalococcoidia bacterium]|nr:MerR family transcriptional regulator [Dehalococcoidia bacterium]